MTSAAQPAGVERYDVRTIVGGGIKLGLITAVGVTAFVLLSRMLSGGTGDTIGQALVVLAGGLVFSYLPAWWVHPRSVDSIAWTALLGLLGALSFTVIDTVLLRPLELYHWTWDAIGGGSGFWYIPIWWMGSAVLAWLGAWVVAIAAGSKDGVHLVAIAGHTAGLAVGVFAILTVTGIGPFHTAMMALAFTLALMLHVPLATVLHRR